MDHEARSVLSDADCIALLQWALPRLGLRWAGFRKPRRQVCRRIAARMRALRLPDMTAYRRLLEANAAEWPALGALCTVSISRFHRDREVFECLRENVLPALAHTALERGAAHLECWSAGCASGEEPYSLAILWRMALADRYPDLDLKVLGTDVVATLLERARVACYGMSSLEELPAPWREAAFEQRANLHCLREPFKRVVFERANLTVEVPARRFDLVLCRNLAFTYFDARLARRTLERIERCLLPGGALVTGTHEKLPPSDFVPWPGCRAIFRRP